MWIDDCVQSHRQCTAPNKAFAPTRLIKVGKESIQDAHLVSSTGPVRYAVLTYCTDVLHHCSGPGADSDD